ncbi:MAG: XdhC family protein, partial [Cryobacterium sp.]
LEPVGVAPAVVIFGLGHVGLELARILSRHDLDLHLVDSRSDMVAQDRLAVLRDGSARLVVHHAPVPESVFDLLPAGTHALIMTHDHVEDVALCDVALRTPRLASIGLIGSSAKWTRFQRRLAEEGHTGEELARIHTPIGVPGIASKDPAAIAVSVAASLLQRFESAAPDAPAPAPAAPGSTAEAAAE